MIYSTINKNQTESLKELASLYVDSFNIAPWNEKWTMDTAAIRIKSIMDTPDFIGYKAEQEGKVTGFILGFIEQFQNDKIFQIKEICVNPALQKTGIGKGLIQKLEEELRKNEIRGIYLITTRQGAVEKFYNSSGFTENSHLLVMQKPMK